LIGDGKAINLNIYTGNDKYSKLSLPSWPLGSRSPSNVFSGAGQSG
jgi:hypothetical protein